MTLLRRSLGGLLAAVVLGLGLVAPAGLTGCAQAASAPVGGYTLVKAYPHDTTAFTEGLFYRDGFLYESTGLKGRSLIRKVNLETGFSEAERIVDSRYFGEGIVDWGKRLYELTWTDEVGWVVLAKSAFIIASAWNVSRMYGVASICSSISHSVPRYFSQARP